MYARGADHYRSGVRSLLVLLALVPGGPAHLGSGDDVQPRDTVSIVESVSPALPGGVKVDIVGGDTFVRVRAPGHSVSVPGYKGEKYVEIAADGTVRENTSSTTSKLNVNRFGFAYVPDETGDVSWRTISNNGTAMWHDHRIHWMSPSTPAVTDSNGTVQHWQIAIVVDGITHTVKGTLYLREGASITWWLTAIPVAAAVALLLSRRRNRGHVLLAVVAAFGAVTGLLQWVSLPAGARITPLLLLFSTGACIAECAAFALIRHPGASDRNEWIAASVSAGAGVTMLLAVWMSWQQVLSAYVPMTGPVWPARIAVVTLAGAGIVAAVDGVMRVMRVQPNPD